MMRFLFSDGCLFAIKGLLGMTQFEGTWLPEGGSRIVAEEALSDERAIEISEAEAFRFMDRFCVEKPWFSALQ